MYSEIIQLLPNTIYSRSGNIKNLFELFAIELNSLDAIFDELRYVRDIENRQGVLLDLIGEILREKRYGYDDVSYRIYLLVAIQKLLCSGSIESLQTVLNAILGEYLIGVYELTPDYQDYLYNDKRIYTDGSRYLDGSYYLAGEPPEGSYSTYEIWLDGEYYLDGTYYLSGTIFQPCMFEIVVASSINNVTLNYVNNIMSYIKPAGVRYRIRKQEA